MAAKMIDEQGATAALSDMSLTPPKLPNFPLPRGLRDQIYSYLLDSEYVRTNRTWSQKDAEDNFSHDRTGPRAYHFHTSILGVNHAIREEAEELLYTRNTFVVLSYQYPKLSTVKRGLIWLPIVSNTLVSRMQKHSVRIHVSDTNRSQPAMRNGKEPIKSAIFLARDLEAFCLIMAVAGLTCPQQDLALQLTTDTTGNPMVRFHPQFGSSKTASQLKCELRDTKYRKIDAATQRQILTPMARILAPSQRVSFSGNICDARQVEHSKQVMSPGLVCLPAYSWAFFEALSLAKDVADAAVRYDDIEFAMHLLIMVSVTIEAFTHTYEDGAANRQAFLLEASAAAEACEILRLEVMVSVACCAIKVQQIDVLSMAAESIRDSFHRIAAERAENLDKIPAQLKAYCYSVLLWQHLHRSTVPNRPTIRKMINHLSVPGHGLHQVHDIEILSRQSDQDPIATLEHLPLEECSAYQLPVPSMSFHKALMEQEKFKDWLDMDLLRSLSEGLKEKIHKQQKQYGIKVTAFDEILQ